MGRSEGIYTVRVREICDYALSLAGGGWSIFSEWIGQYYARTGTTSVEVRCRERMTEWADREKLLRRAFLVALWRIVNSLQDRILELEGKLAEPSPRGAREDGL